MAGQPGFFDGEERLKALSAAGDPLERLAAAIDFEVFRRELERALARLDRGKGGRPPPAFAGACVDGPRLRKKKRLWISRSRLQSCVRPL